MRFGDNHKMKRLSVAISSLFITITITSQVRKEGFYIASGYGVSMINTTLYESNGSPSNHFIDYTHHHGFWVFPFAIGYKYNQIEIDLTHNSKHLSSFDNRMYSSTQFNIGYDLPYLFKKQPKFVLLVGAKYSIINPDLIDYRNLHFIGGYMSVGIRKIRIRSSISTLLGNNSLLNITPPEELVSSRFWTAEILYYIYPFRKNERSKKTKS